MNDLVAVIMAGGRGERFWPQSRKAHPKQLLPIVSKRTMLQETVARIKSLIPYQHIYIATGESLEKEIKRQLPFIPRENIIVEPQGRNTAACIGLAALKISRRNPHSTMVVLPADHLIGNKQAFLKIIRGAAEAARKKGYLITLGIKPLRPETGYGYLEINSRKVAFQSRGGVKAYPVKRFVEKPSLLRAKKFFASEVYYWNSGMFVWQTEVILEAIKVHMPQLSRGLAAIRSSWSTGGEQKVTKKVFQRLKSISIDCGIMEKSPRVMAIKADMAWDDVGSWLAMERIHSRDAQGNAVQGKFAGIDSQNCIIISGGERLVATLGLSDLIVVSTPDVVLICPKERAEEVKKVVGELTRRKLQKYL